MESNGLKRKDTTKGPPLRVLSLDGGGVRGYSMFIIIQEIMHRTFVEIEGRAPRRHEIPKPADHFDLIVGTGTGGLIALMLGRLRLDLETCKELYVRLTRMVFETDKTILGIPTRPTLFKASKLEEAIKNAVREHTIYGAEGNDGSEPEVYSPLSAASRSSAAQGPRRHASNASVVSFSARSPTTQMARPVFNARGGDPNARLYDSRENRTKTAVTAVYKGAPKGTDPVLLRSYDSRKEPAPEYECKIWEAGRATCSIGLAFKPIRIGQSVFHDDGDGRFNPSPEALDEAVVNEWPGREVGVFLSVGTGKRPKGSDLNKAEWYEGFLGEFAEAKRKLIAKIEGCEKTHDYMEREHLTKRGVNIENYYRLNVEIGVGEFGMNEWHRLAEISTSTRMYLSRKVEQKKVQDAAAKMAKIYRAKQRYERMGDIPEWTQKLPEISQPLAVELPGDIPAFTSHSKPPSRQSYESGPDSLSLPAGNTPSPRSSGERVRPPTAPTSNPPPPPRAGSGTPPSRPTQPPPAAPHRASAPPGSLVDDSDRLVVMAPTPAQYRNAAGTDKIAITSPDEHPRWQGSAQVPPHRAEPPPLPPKTPLPENQAPGGARRQGGGYAGGGAPPYPLDDEPPPPVNMARKPDYRGR
ncbi:Calcium-independent phospholipase A2-gamma [Pleurostoma richardsiae]|uniref:Calcium-independent phospholipase A2-gamma n=1 Tax=Pleurostoma richardsiae TaxID=41990 RepID=A0AA38RM95_9PEZI|nr:Calcium-independent phospholipase A2-gamma [Pleurostoma richardsiae]